MSDILTTWVEKIKIYLIFSEMFFTVCAHGSFILGQQMGFLKDKIKLQHRDKVDWRKDTSCKTII